MDNGDKNTTTDGKAVMAGNESEVLSWSASPVDPDTTNEPQTIEKGAPTSVERVWV